VKSHTNNTALVNGTLEAEKAYCGRQQERNGPGLSQSHAVESRRKKSRPSIHSTMRLHQLNSFVAASDDVLNLLFWRRPSDAAANSRRRDGSAVSAPLLSGSRFIAAGRWPRQQDGDRTRSSPRRVVLTGGTQSSHRAGRWTGGVGASSRRRRHATSLSVAWRRNVQRAEATTSGPSVGSAADTHGAFDSRRGVLAAWACNEWERYGQSLACM